MNSKILHENEIDFLHLTQKPAFTCKVNWWKKVYQYECNGNIEGIKTFYISSNFSVFFSLNLSCRELLVKCWWISSISYKNSTEKVQTVFIYLLRSTFLYINFEVVILFILFQRLLKWILFIYIEVHVY